MRFFISSGKGIGEWSILPYDYPVPARARLDRRKRMRTGRTQMADGRTRIPCTSSWLEISNLVFGSISRSCEEVVGKAE